MPVCGRIESILGRSRLRQFIQDVKQRGGINMLYKIGGTIVAFGVMCADSRNLLIPLTIVLIGAFMIVLGVGGDCDDER